MHSAGQLAPALCLVLLAIWCNRSAGSRVKKSRSTSTLSSDGGLAANRNQDELKTNSSTLSQQFVLQQGVPDGAVQIKPEGAKGTFFVHSFSEAQRAWFCYKVAVGSDIEQVTKGVTKEWNNKECKDNWNQLALEAADDHFKLGTLDPITKSSLVQSYTEGDAKLCPSARRSCKLSMYELPTSNLQTYLDVEEPEPCSYEVTMFATRVDIQEKKAADLVSVSEKRSKMTMAEAIKEATAKATRTEETLPASPPTSSEPVKHPGGTIRIGVRLGTKAQGEFGGISPIQEMYPSGSLYSVTAITNLAAIKAENFDLIYDILPGQDHNEEELKAMLALINLGGRLVLVGEHVNYAREENKRITKFINTLGGAVIVRETDRNNNGFTRTNKNINNLPIMAGVERFHTARWASLATDDNCHVLIVDCCSGAGRTNDVVMVEFPLGNGNVLVFADVNVWKTKGSRNMPLSHFDDNKLFFQNVAHDTKINVLRVSGR